MTDLVEECTRQQIPLKARRKISVFSCDRYTTLENLKGADICCCLHFLWSLFQSLGYMGLWAVTVKAWWPGIPAYLQQGRISNLVTLLQVESLHHVSYLCSHPLLLPLNFSFLLPSCCLTLSPPAPNLVPICLELHQFNSLNEQDKAH